MLTPRHALFAMHCSALLWGFTGVLGALTTLDSAVVAVGRSIFALIAVSWWYGIPDIRQALLLRPWLLARVFLGGALLALHWIFFFLSISKGGVAIALVTYAGNAGVIAGSEVLLGWAKPGLLRFLAPVVSLLGIYVMEPCTDMQTLLHNEGLLYGMVSCLFVAAMAINGRALMARNHVDPLAVTIGQLIGAIVCGLPLAWVHSPATFQASDIVILATLGVLCTAFGQTLFNRALQVVPAGTASVIANMEAPYGVVLAAIILGQAISVNVFVGVVLVLVSALLAGKASR